MKIVDMHCDTASVLLEKRRSGEERGLRKNTGHLDLERMRKSGYLLQNFALYVNKNKCGDPWEEVCALYKVYRQELAANEDMIAPALKYDDIVRNECAGKMSALLTVEEGAVCKGETEKLHRLYDMGVRMMTLTWNYPNELGYPNEPGYLNEPGYPNEPGYSNLNDETRKILQKQCIELKNSAEKCQKTDGLTECGREFVFRMEQLGMIVDVSHLSDAGFYDVLESTKKPFVASHSNARGVCGHMRNLTDDMIRRLAERGGVTGLNFYADFLEKKPEGSKNPGTIEAVVRHAKHIVAVGGIEVLGLGSDFDGIDTNEELPGVQSMELLWDAMCKAGFTQSQLDKIFYKNVLRIYEACLN